jgi:uracil-DNA glycosylase
MELQKDLEKWAEKAVKYCNKTAIRDDVNKAFYAFQKPVLPFKEANRELLVIGLNPGENYNFQAQYDNPIWEFKLKEMSLERFLKGNPCWKSYHTWNIANLDKIKSIKSILDADNYYFMNFIYFNTTNINEFYLLDKDGKIREQCVEFTNQFIKLINPKRILVLGTQEGIDKLPNIQTKTILNSKMRLVVQAEYLGYPVVAIPHPSRYNMRKQEELQKMSDIIEQIFNGEKVEKVVLEIDALENQAIKWSHQLAELAKQLSEKLGIEIEIVNSNLKVKYKDFYIFFGEVNGKIYSSIKNEKAFFGKAIFEKKADIFNCDDLKHQKYNPYGLNIFNDWQHWSKDIDVLKEEKGLGKFLLEEIEKLKNWIDDNLSK